MTIKEMRAAKDRQEIREEIREEITPKRSAKRAKDTPQKITAPEIIEDAPEIIEDTPHALPAGLYDDITATIDTYCRQYNIDNPQKMHPHQWKSLCIYIGQSLKARGFIRDTEREKHHGGVLYDGSKLSDLLDLYDYICGQYNQVPFVYNFPRFAGISPQYLADYEGRLTSSRVNLRQKALDIQKAGLVDAVTGGGSATVGNIFLSKALAGLQETVTVQHVSAAAAPTTSALPVFDSSGGGLIESKAD